jgi:hypothetical protein
VEECVKYPSGSQTAARQGDKSEFSPPSLFSLVAALGSALDFTDIAANQLTCPSILTATRSPSLQLQPVIVNGISVVWDLSMGSAPPYSQE